MNGQGFIVKLCERIYDYIIRNMTAAAAEAAAYKQPIDKNRSNLCILLSILFVAWISFPIESDHFHDLICLKVIFSPFCCCCCLFMQRHAESEWPNDVKSISKSNSLDYYETINTYFTLAFFHHHRRLHVHTNTYLCVIQSVVQWIFLPIVINHTNLFRGVNLKAPVIFIGKSIDKGKVLESIYKPISLFKISNRKG